MKEDLIQFIWRSKMLTAKSLKTILSETVEIVYPGNFNTDQGPDFLFAKIKINDILWVGHIEIHIKSSDWIAHNHQNDPNYKNTILHVVWEYDKETTWSERPISCLELKNYISAHVLNSYSQLMDNKQKIACQPFLDGIRGCTKTNQLERMMLERLEEKTEKIKQDLSLINWNWEELLIKKVAHYLTAPVNSEAMNTLWRHMPYSSLCKLRQDANKLTAVLFGVSGLLEKIPQNNTTRQLFDEFEFQKNRLNLEPMNSVEWKWLRLRPAHFPSIRLVQLISLLHHNPNLFSHILEIRTLKELYILFDLNPWLDPDILNFLNQIGALKIPSNLGKQTKDILIINAICPILFTYGTIYQNHSLMDRALEFLEKIKPERNHIIHMWKSFNFVFNHSGHSQGGIQLFQQYCVLKKCTHCSIGNEILNIPKQQ